MVVVGAVARVGVVAGAQGAGKDVVVPIPDSAYQMQGVKLIT